MLHEQGYDQVHGAVGMEYEEVPYGQRKMCRGGTGCIKGMLGMLCRSGKACSGVVWIREGMQENQHKVGKHAELVAWDGKGAQGFLPSFSSCFSLSLPSLFLFQQAAKQLLLGGGGKVVEGVRE